MGFLSFDGQQVLVYKSPQLKAKGQRHRLRREQHGRDNELGVGCGVTVVHKVALGPADIPFLSHLPCTSPTSDHSFSKCFLLPLKCGGLR